eukprot:CAMPEP_0182448080 /NCGR_PEP_ID=MMETSP1172-20130603/23304_1 /TAXON_ID=708627 /ORGANISM="Timspurckia oligopyrenoides, Strain CCMP3278" /LENGTH=373 /DNA_ID=CAMNT_0024644801 /DNA_START=197 /DNA_END=1315 /DNA_ORIENTATION=-
MNTPLDSSSSDANSDLMKKNTEASTHSLRKLLSTVSPDLASNAVVDSLCREGKFAEALLITESMNASRIALKGSSVSALIDGAARFDSPNELLSAFETIDANQSLYGFNKYQLPRIQDMEELYYAPVTKSEQIALESADSERTSELLLAVTVSSTALGSISLEVIDPLILHQSADTPTALLILLGSSLLADRFLFSAQFYHKVAGGLRRLIRDDPARECSVEAALLLSSYLLGLPFLCFQPNAQQIVSFHANLQESPIYEKKVKDGDMLNRYLVWMIMGIVAELRVDSRLIESDVSMPKRLLEQAERKNIDGLKGKFSLAQRRNRLNWAWIEAEKLLDQYKQLHNTLTNKMLDGYSAGECVMIIEQHMKNPNF